jgi:peptidoglycan hydrolase-like protein with peptidoglycan-binding domain
MTADRQSIRVAIDIALRLLLRRILVDEGREVTDKEETTQLVAEQEPLPNYRVIQKGVTLNIPVTDFESLVTHHPGDNSGARVIDGIVVRGQQGRNHAVVGNEIQEIEVAIPGRTFGLKEDQVLLKKDFILEDSCIASGGRGARDVDVPSPVSGYVGNVDKGQGLVDIYDREGGDVIARIRHMSGIQVSEKDTIEYGQALGTQSNVGTKPIHVHMEMDTRYYQNYENYIADLTSGRLSIDANRRTQGIEPLPIVDDGAFRIGESGDRVRDMQRMLAEEGYRGRDNRPAAQDGVYRLDMQPAVLAFQRDHNVPQTGDIDRATLALVPMPVRRELDRPDHNDPRQGPSVPNLPGGYGAPPHQHSGRDEAERMLQQLGPQARNIYERGHDAVQAHGGYGEEQARNIAATGVRAFSDSVTTRQADDVGVYGDRLRITSFPHGREREPNFPVDVRLSEAAHMPEAQSLQAALDRQQTLAQQQSRQQDMQTQGQSPSGPSIGARTV